MLLLGNQSYVKYSTNNKNTARSCGHIKKYVLFAVGTRINRIHQKLAKGKYFRRAHLRIMILNLEMQKNGQIKMVNFN